MTTKILKGKKVKISNFRNLRRSESFNDNGLTNYFDFADVDVETGVLWWKKKTTVTVSKDRFSRAWRFKDTGEYTPQFLVENLFRVYEMDKFHKKLDF